MRKTILFLSILLWLTACKNENPVMPPAAIQPTLSSIQTNVFNLKCAVAGCHVIGGIAPMSLAATDAFTNLVNVPSATYGTPRFLRVKPGIADSSTLYMKVTGSPLTGGAAARMPAGLGPLSNAEVSAIQTWINNGALNN
jgi:hypothetical protein